VVDDEGDSVVGGGFLLVGEGGGPGNGRHFGNGGIYKGWRIASFDELRFEQQAAKRGILCGIKLPLKQLWESIGTIHVILCLIPRRKGEISFVLHQNIAQNNGQHIFTSTHLFCVKCSVM
jgi:hypothetical protein